jgi:hypothetical protein
MKLLKIAPVFFLLVVVLSSCSKEESFSANGNTPGSGSTGILGTWKLISISGSSAVKDSFDMAGIKYVGTSLYSYTSTTASGTYTITATDFIGKDIAYKADGKLVMDIYMDGQLLTHIDTITPIDIPPTNATAPYIKQGSDSLYFTGGGMFSMQGGTSTTVVPGGLKYKLEGNKLTLTMKQVSNETIVENGVSIIRKLNAAATVVLQKQ